MTQNLDAYRITQAYRGAAVTVPPLKAVVMLFDGAIMFLQKTIEATEARRFEESHRHLVRATTILRGLSHHLNFEKGGPLADRLYRTYSSLIMAALRAFGRPDATQRYRKLILSLTELRDAWKSVAAQTAKPAGKVQFL
jgi:flagellar secretion chaperone FliS